MGWAKIEKDIWNVLNSFRMSHFLTDTKAEVDVGKFDDMMDKIKELLLTAKEESLMARKPFSLKDLRKQVRREIAPEEICDMVRTHKILPDVFEDWDEFQKANLSGNRWWRIILQKEKVELLVDTQGYDYPRHIGVLNKESTKFTQF